MANHETIAETAALTAGYVALGGVAYALALKNRALKRDKRTLSKDNESLRHAATHDSLTGMFNLRGLEETLNENRPPMAALYIDGTYMKTVNDTLGHLRGDEAIASTADVIRKSVRPADIIARVGGDEFIVMLDGKLRKPKGDKNFGTPEDILDSVVSRMREETRLFLSDNQDLQKAGFNIAVGGVVWQEGMGVENLMMSAEMAMYEDKDAQHQEFGNRPRP